MEISYYDYLRDVGSVYLARNRVLDSLVYNLRPQKGLGNQTPFVVVRKYYPTLDERFFVELPPIIYKGDEPSPVYLLEEKGVDLLRVKPKTEFFEEQAKGLLTARMKIMHLQRSWKRFMEKNT